MLISVIVPVYCVESYLEECINSILNQSFSDFELLLIVDGSTDNSESICKHYERLDERVRVFVKKNEGPLLARKLGLRYAKGDYLVFIDGDDYIDQGYFKEIYRIINSFKPDVLCFSYNEMRNINRIVTNNHNKEGLYKEKKLDAFLNGFLWNSKEKNISNTGTLSYSLWDKVFKKELFCNIIDCVNEHIKIGEDLLCCLFYFNKCSSLYLSNSCFYNYRIVDSSLINNYVPNNSILLNNTVIELSKIPFVSKEKVSVYSYHIFLFIVAKIARSAKNYGEFRAEMKKVYKCNEMFEYLLSIDYKICTLIERFKVWHLKKKKLCLLYLLARATR